MNASGFSERAIELVAEMRIAAAMDAGEFDNLPGFGQPFEFDDSSYDPYWWVRRKLERETMNNLFRSAPAKVTATPAPDGGLAMAAPDNGLAMAAPDNGLATPGPGDGATATGPSDSRPIANQREIPLDS